tara:strand:- start:1249 stop:1578 length:330 start_codon:yes stop_codon:yes gene_type:complete
MKINTFINHNSMINNKVYKKLNKNLQEKIYKKLFKYVDTNQKQVINDLNDFFYYLEIFLPPTLTFQQINNYLGYVKLLYLINIFIPKKKYKKLIRYWTKFVIWSYNDNI